MNRFVVFKQILFGGVSKEQLRIKLIEESVHLNTYADILCEHDSFSIGERPEKVKLVRVKLEDLQLTKPCVFQKIIERALELNLKLCPLSLAAFLRLSYLEQPNGPFLTIASNKPESNDDSYPNGFYLRRIDDLLWLRGYRATSDYEWPLDSEFVFQK